MKKKFIKRNFIKKTEKIILAGILAVGSVAMAAMNFDEKDDSILENSIVDPYQIQVEVPEIDFLNIDVSAVKNRSAFISQISTDDLVIYNNGDSYSAVDVYITIKTNNDTVFERDLNRVVTFGDSTKRVSAFIEFLSPYYGMERPIRDDSGDVILPEDANYAPYALFASAYAPFSDGQLPLEDSEVVKFTAFLAPQGMVGDWTAFTLGGIVNEFATDWADGDISLSITYQTHLISSDTYYMASFCENANAIIAPGFIIPEENPAFAPGDIGDAFVPETAENLEDDTDETIETYETFSEPFDENTDETIEIYETFSEFLDENTDETDEIIGDVASAMDGESETEEPSETINTTHNDENVTIPETAKTIVSSTTISIEEDISATQI